jgi:glycine cleavage system H lipoate-binding protein
MVKLKMADAAELDSLLSADAYQALVAEESTKG